MNIPENPTTEDCRQILLALTAHTVFDSLSGKTEWEIVWRDSWLAGRTVRAKLKVNLYGSEDAGDFSAL